MSDEAIKIPQASSDDSMREWMIGQNLWDVNSPNFALTSRTRRLRVQGTEGADEPKGRPFVTVIAIPQYPLRELWAASDTSIYNWLKEPARRYDPFSKSDWLPPQTRAMHRGVMLEQPDYRTGQYASRYLAIERTGVIELGLGSSTCVLLDDRKGFFLANMVASVWQVIGLASDLFGNFKQKQPFTLLVNLRETGNTVLAGLAQGCAPPFGYDAWVLLCPEPHVQIRHNTLGPELTKDAARALAREVAFEIEEAWGHGGPGSFPRCFRLKPEDKSEGEFDISACRN